MKIVTATSVGELKQMAEKMYGTFGLCWNSIHSVSHMLVRGENNES